MTKYSKITKSTFAIIALSLILVAVLAFGGTYAYFSAKDDIGGVASMGKLQLSLKNNATDATALVTAGQILVPNQTLVNEEQYTIDMGETNIDFFVRVKFGVEITNTNGEKGAQEPAIADAITATLTGFTRYDQTNYYYIAASDADITAAMVAADAEATTDNKTFSLTIKVSNKVGEDGSAYYMGATVTVTCEVEAIQANCLEGLSYEGTVSKVSDLHDAWEDYVSVEANA